MNWIFVFSFVHNKFIDNCRLNNFIHTELGGFVVTHEIRIREVPDSIPWPTNLDEVFSGLLNLKIAHSPTFPSLHLRHHSFSNPSVALSNVTAHHSPTLPLLYLRHSSFSNPSFASPTSQAPLNSPGEPPMVKSIVKPKTTTTTTTTTTCYRRLIGV